MSPSHQEYISDQEDSPMPLSERQKEKMAVRQPTSEVAASEEYHQSNISSPRPQSQDMRQYISPITPTTLYQNPFSTTNHTIPSSPPPAYTYSPLQNPPYTHPESRQSGLPTHASAWYLEFVSQRTQREENITSFSDYAIMYQPISSRYPIKVRLPPTNNSPSPSSSSSQLQTQTHFPLQEQPQHQLVSSSPAQPSYRHPPSRRQRRPLLFSRVRPPHLPSHHTARPAVHLLTDKQLIHPPLLLLPPFHSTPIPSPSTSHLLTSLTEEALRYFNLSSIPSRFATMNFAPNGKNQALENRARQIIEGIDTKFSFNSEGGQGNSDQTPPNLPFDAQIPNEIWEWVQGEEEERELLGEMEAEEELLREEAEEEELETGVERIFVIDIPADRRDGNGSSRVAAEQGLNPCATEFRPRSWLYID